MHDTALYPPNSQQLSENVIGKVEVRTRQLSEGPHTTQFGPSHRVSDELEPTESLSIVENDASPPADQDTSGQSSAERALARHRLVRRNIQRRYRKKLQNKGIDLEKSVTQLRAEIQRLQEVKSQPQRILIAMTPWKAMVEQSRLFRYGFRPPVPVSELCSDKTPQCSDLAYVQTRFTQTIMAPDVHDNAGYGIKAGLENWRLISLHHENLDIELTRLERGPGDSVVAYQNAITTVTANMLRQALPHLVDDERGWDPVAVKLIGQKLVVPGTLRFDWDPSTNKVVRTHYEIKIISSYCRSAVLTAKQ